MWHVPLLLVATRWICSRKLKMGIARYQKKDLLFLKDLIEAGEYRAVIDRTYPLEEVIEATRYVETEQKTGNVVLRLAAHAEEKP
jgi:NADPH:quinone reductase-like Zn-dependent oxidoreductase